MTVKLKLGFEFDYDFTLFGISCHEREHRICWSLNNALSFQFRKSEDLEISSKKQEETSRFSLFEYEEDFTHYFLLSNRNASGHLVPEQKQADYLVMVRGNLPDERKAELLASLRKAELVLAAFEIDVEQLRSKQKLIF